MGALGKLPLQSPKFRDAASDEEHNALGHHDLVVILHLAQCCLDLLWREGLFLVPVDRFCEASHAHRLCMSFPEHRQESHFERLQPAQDRKNGRERREQAQMLSGKIYAGKTQGVIILYNHPPIYTYTQLPRTAAPSLSLLL